MDPVTLALISGAVSGVAGEAYQDLKEVIVARYGRDAQLPQSIANLEARPQSQGRQQQLEEEVAEVGAANENAIRQAADELLETLRRAQPGTVQAVQQAYGNFNAQSSGGGSASVNVTLPERDKP